MKKNLAALVAGVILLGAPATAATYGAATGYGLPFVTDSDYVRQAEGDEFVPGTALRKDFEPLPGQETMPENAFLNAARQSSRALDRLSDERLLEIRHDTCRLVDHGLSPEVVTGFVQRREGLGVRAAEVVTVAALGSCESTSVLGSLLDEDGEVRA